MHQIEETGRFLIDIMPILFVPSAVGIISQFDQLKSIWMNTFGDTSSRTSQCY